MKLQTPVQDIPCACPISYDEKIMFIGSCFSDNVGKILDDYGFDVLVNPFGTLYNPASIKES
ncbi:MAG: GSCFA domain-containing protein, partial [Candidatus Cryptobacteroides sp.]